MRFKIENTLIVSRLQKLQKIIPEKSIIPIDQYVLFEYRDGKELVITGIGSGVSLQCELIAYGNGSFTAAVPFRALLKTIALFSNKETDFAFKAMSGGRGELHVKSGRGSGYKFSCEDPGLYPSMKMGEPTSHLQVDSNYLKRVFGVAGSFIEDPNSPIMNQNMQGINMSAHGEYIEVTASTRQAGYRSRFYACDIVKSFDTVLLPRILGEIASEVMNDNEDIKVYHDGNVLHMPGQLFDIKCSLTEFKFPYMDGIFGQREHCHCVVFDKDELSRAIRRLKIHNDEHKELVMDIKKDRVTMSASSELYGNEGEEVFEKDMPVEGQICMNLYATLNALSKIETNNIRFYYLAPNIAYFITPDFGDAESSAYQSSFILMPIIHLAKK